MFKYLNKYFTNKKKSKYNNNNYENIIFTKINNPDISFLEYFSINFKAYQNYKKKRNIKNIYEILLDIPIKIKEQDIFIFKEFKNIFDFLNIKIPNSDDLKYINANKPLKIKTSYLLKLDFYQIFIYYYIKTIRFCKYNKALTFFIFLINFILLIFTIIFYPILIFAIIFIKFLIIEILAFIFKKHKTFKFYKNYYKINLEVQQEFFEKSFLYKNKKKYYNFFYFIKILNLLYLLKDKISLIFKTKRNIFIENNNIYISTKFNEIITLKKNKFFNINLLYIKEKLINIIKLKHIQKSINALDYLNFKIHGFLFFLYKAETTNNINPEPLTIKKKQDINDIISAYLLIMVLIFISYFILIYGIHPLDIALNIIGFYDFLFDIIWEFLKKQYYNLVYYGIIYKFSEFFNALLNVWIIHFWALPIVNLIINFIHFFLNIFLFIFYYCKYFPRYYIEYFFIFYTNIDFKTEIFNILIYLHFFFFNFTTEIFKFFLEIIIPIIYKFNIDINYLYFLYNLFYLFLIIIPILLFIKLIFFLQKKNNKTKIIFLIFLKRIYKFINNLYILIKPTLYIIINYIIKNLKKIFKNKFVIIKELNIPNIFNKKKYINIILEYIHSIIFIFWDHKNFFLIKKKDKNNNIIKYHIFLNKFFLFLDIFILFSFKYLKIYSIFYFKNIKNKILNIQYLYNIFQILNKIILFIIIYNFLNLYILYIIPYIHDIYLSYFYKNLNKINIFIYLLIQYEYNNLYLFCFFNVIIYLYFELKNIKNLNIIILKIYIYKFLIFLSIYIIFIPNIPFGIYIFFLFIFIKYKIYNKYKILLEQYFKKYASFQNFIILFQFSYLLFFYFFIINFFFFIFFYFFKIHYFIILIFTVFNILILIITLKLIPELNIYFKRIFFINILKKKSCTKLNTKTKILFNISNIKLNLFYFFLFIFLNIHLNIFFFQNIFKIYNYYLIFNNNYFDLERILEEIEEETENN